MDFPLKMIWCAVSSSSLPRIVKRVPTFHVFFFILFVFFCLAERKGKKNVYFSCYFANQAAFKQCTLYRLCLCESIYQIILKWRFSLAIRGISLTAIEAILVLERCTKLFHWNQSLECAAAFCWFSNKIISNRNDRIEFVSMSIVHCPI